jgi:DNA-binding CsgD family transcriptional regulator
MTGAPAARRFDSSWLTARSAGADRTSARCPIPCLVIERSVEIYGALIAALFAGLGIWLGLTITRKKPEVVVREVRVPIEAPATPFRVNEDKVRELGLTPRELEVLGLIADGLSTREIAEKAFVSENTVKTHSSRLFDKLGAKRRAGRPDWEVSRSDSLTAASPNG